MMNLRSHAEHTSEILRDLVSQLIIKHELSALEIMCELKAENVRLRNALRLAADEPNIDRARKIADEALGD